MREDREDPVNWLLLLRQGYIGKVLLNRNLVPVGERDPVPECARLGPHSLLLISDNHNTLSFPFFFSWRSTSFDGQRKMENNPL